MSYLLLSAEPASLFSSFGVLAVTFAMMYFFLIAPQKKRDKAVAAMRSNLEVGDEIVTEGGIIATVVSIKEDTILVETGSDRVKIRLARWSVRDIITKSGK